MDDQYERLMAAVREWGAEVLAAGANPYPEPDANVQRLHRAVEREARILEASAKWKAKRETRTLHMEQEHSGPCQWCAENAAADEAARAELAALIQQRAGVSP